MLCMSLPPLIEALQTVAEAGLDLLGAQRAQWKVAVPRLWKPAIVMDRCQCNVQIHTFKGGSRMATQAESD